MKTPQLRKTSQWLKGFDVRWFSGCILIEVYLKSVTKTLFLHSHDQFTSGEACYDWTTSNTSN